MVKILLKTTSGKISRNWKPFMIYILIKCSYWEKLTFPFFFVLFVSVSILEVLLVFWFIFFRFNLSFNYFVFSCVRHLFGPSQLRVIVQLIFDRVYLALIWFGILGGKTSLNQISSPEEGKANVTRKVQTRKCPFLIVDRLKLL